MTSKYRHLLISQHAVARGKSHRQGENIENWWPDRSEPPCVLLSLLWISASIYQGVPQLSKASVSINKANNHRLQTACLSATVLSLTFTLPHHLKLPATESSHSAAGKTAQTIIKGCGPMASTHNAIMCSKHTLTAQGTEDQKQDSVAQDNGSLCNVTNTLNKNQSEDGCQLTGRAWNTFSFEEDASFWCLWDPSGRQDGRR